jgi:hypothetical protein
MKATTSIRQPLLFGNLIILLVTFLSFSFNSLVAKNNAKLSQVFTSEAAPNDKQVLKLYDDNSYEFLHFVIAHKKPKVIREQGSYVLESKKLKLKSRNKKGVIDHPKHYFFLSEKGLFKSRAQSKKVNAAPALATNKDSKYYEAFYIDSVFGKVSNDQKVFNKLADPKLKEKPKVVEPVEIIEDEPIAIQEKEVETKIDSKLLNQEEKVVIKSKNAKLKSLKAVIIVAEVDSKEPDGWWNKTFEAEHKKSARYLREQGIQVTEFYTSKAKWKDIVAACQGANIFIYAGHGSNQGINYESGGLCLADGIIHASDIMSKLNLHKNALIIFNNACYAGGSSSGDKVDIGCQVAQKRVAEYAYPFLKPTNGAYWAASNTDCVIPFFKMFFEGKTLKYIYMNKLIDGEKIEAITAYNYDKSYEVCVSSRLPSREYYELTTTFNNKKTTEKVKAHKDYGLAYVSRPNYSILDLMKK